MIRRPPRSTHCISSAASDVYKRQVSTQSTWATCRTQVHLYEPRIEFVVKYKIKSIKLKTILPMLYHICACINSSLYNLSKLWYYITFPIKLNAMTLPQAVSYTHLTLPTICSV
eukprot:TRINITY_DN24342_c0_g2_i1.p1 TRINITY_DN24342_c0_g2~~TRINITY_DN24342_c0_g2_i1.p1  ORF type:complete len:123 (-),score=14.46 TRINITY_DN24342_c0_g2_i1:51-392(-)